MLNKKSKHTLYNMLCHEAELHYHRPSYIRILMFLKFKKFMVNSL